MSSSAICSHFTQNAWKKDLCSNCFKSKDEHKQANSTFTTSKFSSALRSNNAAKVITVANGGQKFMEADHRKTDYPNKHKTPGKSIIKTRSQTTKVSSKGKSYKVSFRKTISEVIGYGGEWSDNDSDDDDHDFMNLGNERDDNAGTSTDDEETLELKRITRANTDFNMNNGNLLGDAQENIKRSFAALKLGAPQVDKEGKKQTLKINVVPFGATAAPVPAQATATMSGTDSAKPVSIAATHSTVKAKFETQNASPTKVLKKTVTTQVMKMSTTQVVAAASINTASPSKLSTSTTYALSSTMKQDVASSSDSDGKNSPPIERAMEKSLLDEISETLEQKQSESKKLAAAQATTPSKIKFEITSLSETIESNNKPFLELKKPIARNPPITKEHAKPKINVFHKYSDTDSNCSDGENSISAYYDVVESQISYENLPDGKCAAAAASSAKGKVAVTKGSSAAEDANSSKTNSSNNNKQKYSSSQYITDMLLSSKTRAASYNLHEGNFMTSKITSDGLIVTKCSSDDALDSTGSSFDGSSDEEASYNMIRSESDSGIGISIGNEYKNIQTINDKDNTHPCLEKKLSVSTNNSDYEDIQVVDQRPALPKPNPPQPGGQKQSYIPEKSRELHGEPDGSADPDGSLENKEPPSKDQSQPLPALPKSPPPSKLIDARPSFLHGLQKQHPPILLKKPDLPAKPIVSPVNSPLKTFIAKRQPTNVEQQVISQLQMVMSKSIENLNADLAKDDPKLKKGRAPNPPPEHKSSAPPTPERDYNMSIEFEEHTKREEQMTASAAGEDFGKHQQTADEQHHLAKQQHQMSKFDEDDTKKSNVRTEIDKSNTKPPTTSTTITTTPAALAPGEATAIATSSTSAASSGTVTNVYVRKSALTTLASSNNNSNSNSTTANIKSTSSPVIKEKDKRERAVINPKFRSLNTFVTQRNNAAKNIQLQSATSSLSLKHPMTPEPVPRSQQKSGFSMSQECLAGAGGASGLDKKPVPPQKTKTKFSIKKFLRMGASKTTDNLHKKDNGYSEICTGDDTGVVGKPRLVIIHPIDINPAAVEVVKDITKTNDSVKAQTVAVFTSKPPAPPLRATDAQRATELNKPARPPPPKSAELRRKQQINLASTGRVGDAGGSVKSKADNVYANLGEIRSAIAPRKPERTASMREREAQLELVRKRHENADTNSICSSNGDIVSAADEQKAAAAEGNGMVKKYNNNNNNHNNNNSNSNANNSNTSTLSPQLATAHGGRSTTDGKPPSGSRTSTFERKKSDTKISIASKLEIFENRNISSSNNNNNNNNSNNNNSSTNNSQNDTNNSSSTSANTNSNNLNPNEARPSSLKDSVRKINSTIDSYLKDKRDYENMYDFVKGPASPPPPPARSVDLNAGLRRRPNLYSDTASVASYTRSEFGPTRNYGLNSSLANIPRVISASYCGSEVGEFDIYAPYSYYGSEAGGDVAADINDSVWGLPSAIKNRAKATNRLRMRKGRSVVHKTIEDNYTAVVVANHEALAQVLDQLQQSPVIPLPLRPLANAINLRFEDFTILDGAQAFVVGKKAFHSAVWTTVQVTLALSADCNQLSGVGGELNQLSGGVSGVLNPITEFCDLVPSYHLPLMPTTEVTLMQATISVLPRLQLDTLQSIGTILKGKSQVLDKSNFNFRGSIPNLAGLKDTFGSNALRNVVSVQNLSTLNEECSLEKSAPTDVDIGSVSTLPGMPAFDDVMTREVAFIMLQLVNGMKSLQAKAIEEMPLSLSNVVLSKDVDNKDAQARLCVLQGNNNDEDEPMGTLCKCAHIALTEMLPTTRITSLLGNLLQQERAESLSKAKSVLEFVLWGPSDVVLSGSLKERELALQRWLDLERATVLHGLVRTRVELTIYDECHLMFLVRSTAKMMNDAAKIVCSYQEPLAATNE